MGTLNLKIDDVDRWRHIDGGTAAQHACIPGGGGGTQVQRRAAPALRISRMKVSFLRPPHVRDFVKEGYFKAANQAKNWRTHVQVRSIGGGGGGGGGGEEL